MVQERKIRQKISYTIQISKAHISAIPKFPAPIFKTDCHVYIYYTCLSLNLAIRISQKKIQTTAKVSLQLQTLFYGSSPNQIHPKFLLRQAGWEKTTHELFTFKINVHKKHSSLSTTLYVMMLRVTQNRIK